MSTSSSHSRNQPVAMQNSRRRFLHRSIALGASALWAPNLWADQRSSSQATKSLFNAMELNHLSLEIRSLDLSQDFYRVVFGLTAINHGRAGGDQFMHFAEGFINMRPSGKTGMNHYCLGIQDFDGDAVIQMLDLAETDPYRMGGRNVHCFDPDRLNVQVQEERHGWGRINGSQLVESENGVFKTTRIHHVSLDVTDLDASESFYQEVFGLPVVSKRGDRVLMAVGPSAYLELLAAKQAGMNHFCLAVENLDVKNTPDRLRDAVQGPITEIEPGVLRFADPQGTLVEVTTTDHQLT